MSEWKIFHNPLCSKSREVLRLLEEADIQPLIIDYLKEPPSAATIVNLIVISQEAPEAFVRKKEEAFRGFESVDLSTAESVAKLISSHPILLERPIVCRGNKAVIARPPEKVKTILGVIDKGPSVNRER